MSKIKSITAMINIETKCRDDLIRRKIKLMAKLSPDGIRTNCITNDADSIHGNSSKAFEDILPEIMELQQQINEHNREIDVLINLKDQILEQISSIDAVDTKVKYLRDRVGFSLQEIALVLGYGYGYIRKISAKLDQEEKNNKK
ncbi:hypothetical protein LNN31_18895 [Acetobacterium wieringae]|uniref:Sigma-70 family RNA polymerase sigma factor n=1 Tax=Acetobacterium wieringae TaxID=52694 RepID=A0ABY6HEL1_9FIRM|nr:hypothetical protein [Acetobacterium wieringae]UYO62807.1 hypothetical protein LNN31_18895 [Acetobacterium wieringae]